MTNEYNFVQDINYKLAHFHIAYTMVFDSSKISSMTERIDNSTKQGGVSNVKIFQLRWYMYVMRDDIANKCLKDGMSTWHYICVLYHRRSKSLTLKKRLTQILYSYFLSQQNISRITSVLNSVYWTLAICLIKTNNTDLKCQLQPKVCWSTHNVGPISRRGAIQGSYVKLYRICPNRKQRLWHKISLT